MDSNSVADILSHSINGERCSAVGVLPRDLVKIEEIQRFPACVIANTDTSDKPGKHWVAFYLRTPDDYDFFDSYGQSPSTYDFSPSLCSPSSLNTYSLQLDRSNTCGPFCLYYLARASLGYSLDEIAHSFSHSNRTWNDKLVKKHVARINARPSFFRNPTVPCPIKQISKPKHSKRF